MIPRTGITVTKKELFGLLVVFIIYVLLGGVIFMLLESPWEDQLRREFVQLKDEFEEKLANFKNANVTKEDMESIIMRLAAAHSNNLIGDDGNDTQQNWSFDNSFFFAITVVTTIGYGHLAPSTTPGRLFCLVYATFGIPLTGILLAAIGGHFSQHLVRKLQGTKNSKNPKLALALTAITCLLPWFLVFLVLPAVFFYFVEGWSFVEGFYYCFITLSTIGFGDYVAANYVSQYTWMYKCGVVLWIIFGLGYLAMILNYISRAMRCKHIRRVERRLSTSFHNTQQRVGQRLEEVYQILHEVSRHRSMKPRNRALKRMQSFPAPELRDRNHNHKIQKLLNLVQHLKEEEEKPPRPRRLSLPLPDTSSAMSATGARGSLQVCTGTNEYDLMRNGLRRKTPEKGVHTRKPVAKELRASDKRVTVIDVIAEKHTVIDLEGLQCTRV